MCNKKLINISITKHTYIQTNYKKSALEIVKYSGSKSISDLLGASIKNFDYSQYTKIPIWMEQNHQDDLKNSDDLENQEIV